MSFKVKAVLFFLTIHSALLAWWYLMPEQGINLGWGIHLSAPSMHRGTEPAAPDLLKLHKLASDASSNSVKGEKKLEGRLRLHLPGNSWEALRYFFRSLDKLERAESAQVRIMHYGDSQIDDDRVTSALREAFQQRFGGCGVGFIPIADTRGRRYALEIIPSQNWQRFLGYSSYRKEYPKSEFGLSLSTYRFQPTIDGEVPKAGLSVVKNILSGYVYKDFTQAVLLYRSTSDELIVRSSGLDGILDSISLPQTNSPAIGSLGMASSYQISSLSLEGSNAEVLGLSLECADGIVIDNLALRGASGLEFSKASLPFLQQQLDLVSPSLILYQFGVNQTENDGSNYRHYRKALLRQLQVLKGANPQQSIVVVGIPDQALYGPGYSFTNPNVLLIRDAQREAALKAGCAFWDLFEVMGGEGSMTSWVKHEPPLAMPDHTHFTFKGGTLIGRLLYSALILEYQNWKAGSYKTRT